MSRAREALLATALIAALCALAWGCSYATGVREIEGRKFPAEQVSTLHRGMTPQEVREKLGEPLEIRSVEGGESWRYYCKLRQEGTKWILGVFPVVTRGESWSREALLIFRGGVVDSVTGG